MVIEKLSVNWTSFRSSCLRTKLSLSTLQLFQIVRHNIIGFWTCLPHEEYWQIHVVTITPKVHFIMFKHKANEPLNYYYIHLYRNRVSPAKCVDTWPLSLLPFWCRNFWHCSQNFDRAIRTAVGDNLAERDHVAGSLETWILVWALSRISCGHGINHLISHSLTFLFCRRKMIIITHLAGELWD